MEIVTKTEYTELVGPRPIQFKLRRHTLADLMSIELEPSRWLVRPVLSDYQVPELVPEAMLRDAYIEYKVRASRNKSPWARITFNNRLDRMRDKLHRLLLRWKVIV